MSYIIRHATKGEELERHDDLYPALEGSRRLSRSRRIPASVEDASGVVLAVSFFEYDKATDVMKKVRARNFEAATSRPLAKAEVDACGSHRDHDWIWFTNEPHRVYQCRMCRAFGSKSGERIQRVRCVVCDRFAVRAVLDGRHGGVKPKWLCTMHEKQ